MGNLIIIPICCVERRKAVWQRRIVFWGGQIRIVVELQINDRCSYILVEKVKGAVLPKTKMQTHCQHSFSLEHVIYLIGKEHVAVVLAV